MAKRVRLSSDGGSTYLTLPGNTGEMQNEAGTIDDTVFGQDFASTQTGMIGWTVSANGLYKGFAGYVAKILRVGTTTALTDEPMSLVSGKTYEVTDAAKRVLDRSVAIVVEDSGTPVDAEDIESIDYLFGRVTFIPSYTPAGAITIASGSYFPMVVLGCSNAFTLTQTANPVDNTCMDVAQANSGHRTFEYGLKTVSLELQGIYKAVSALRALLVSRAEIVIEINPDGNSKSVARGFFKAVNHGQSGDVGDLEQETVTFNLSVPQDDAGMIPYPFHWMHAVDTTLSLAVQLALTAWEDSDTIDVQYLPDGINGVEGECIVTDVSLAGGLEVMNEFTVALQGSGALAVVP